MAQASLVEVRWPHPSASPSRGISLRLCGLAQHAASAVALSAAAAAAAAIAATVLCTVALAAAPTAVAALAWCWRHRHKGVQATIVYGIPTDISGFRQYKGALLMIPEESILTDN
ncbi:unnamed protein product [Durusdinium trenchii]|uniref:Uncharacterized protein n=1 Tax=Durusdinium trenchii TaxID=1381693 RepID=A0ABP0QL21_9DINO